jgi:diguanylate cyclase (GGDEF)-like protein/PAS domain S-box-containing protein
MINLPESTPDLGRRLAHLRLPGDFSRMPRSSLLVRVSGWLGARAKTTPSASSQALALLAQNSSDVIFRFGPDGRARYISPSVEKLFGYTQAEMYATGSDVSTNGFLHPDDKAMVGAAVKRHFQGELAEVKLEFRIINRGGEILWVQTNCSAVADASGRVTDIIFTMRDISELKALEAQLKAQARTDGLTGVANRRAFDEALELEWRRTLGDRGELSLLLVDADHFKAFNDSNVHQVGDDCLRTLASQMLGMFQRAGDIVARYGGEEFAIILPQTCQAEAVAMGERLCSAIEALCLPHPASPVSRYVTVSVGSATAMATAGGTIDMPQGLLIGADRALYRAKASGRNRVAATLLLKADQPKKAA